MLFIADLLFIVDPSDVTKCYFVQLNFQQISHCYHGQFNLNDNSIPVLLPVLR